MTYTRTTWVNGSQPAIDAIHLNNLEDGVSTALDKAQAATTPLARVIYAPTASKNYATTANTAPVDVDATNLAITFTAPSTGAVAVYLEGYCYLSSTTGTYLWSLRNGTTNVPGTERAVYYGSTNRSRMSVRIPITGLTPGASYTYKWAHRSITYIGYLYVGGSSSEFTAGTVNYGPMIMEVSSA